MKKQLFLSLFAIATVFILSGCGHEVRNINAGYVGKLLTPTGYDNRILEAGQVDLGVKADNDQYTSLVLLEASSITIKEEFHQADGQTDAEDHRVMTLNKTPLTVDIRVQMSLPKEDKLRNVAFNL